MEGQEGEVEKKLKKETKSPDCSAIWSGDFIYRAVDSRIINFVSRIKDFGEMSGLRISSISISQAE